MAMITDKNILTNTQQPIQATTSPTNNIQQLNSNTNNAVNQPMQNATPITIPIQIQPQIQTTMPTQDSSNINVNRSNEQVQNSINAPTPVQYQKPQTATQQQTFDYQSSANKYYNYTPVQVPTAPQNTIQGQYQSSYSEAINQIANQILNMRFNYNPNEDDLLKQASQYVTQTTFENMNSKGILNSSMTAERVAKVVGDLIPQYEKLAREEFDTAFNQMLNTANLLMSMDEREFSIWKDARDQQWQEKLHEHQKQQDNLQNAWKRVDELGYVDNNASTILGVPVGTLSKDARESKEAYERELEKMKKQAEIQMQTEKELANFKNDLEKDLYKYQKSISNTSTSNNKTSYSTYDSIIKNRFADYDSYSHKYTINDNNSAWNYIKSENQAGRMDDTTAMNLINMYGLKNPGNTTNTSSTSNKSSGGLHISFLQGPGLKNNVRDDLTGKTYSSVEELLKARSA